MFIFYQPDVSGGYLSEEESRHASKVLRLNTGDSIMIVDGLGTYYQALLLDTHPKKCTFEVVNRHRQPSRPYRIKLLIAPTKNLDRMEWLIEKLTEIGIDTIQFVQCQHSERRVLKLDRLVRKAVSAMKQSGRAYLPQLLPLLPLKSWQSADSDQKFMAYLGEDTQSGLFQVAKPASDYTVLIGPEGGFAPEEADWAVQQGFGLVRLGNFRLRTETAGLMACHTLHLINEQG